MWLGSVQGEATFPSKDLRPGVLAIPNLRAHSNISNYGVSGQRANRGFERPVVPIPRAAPGVRGAGTR